MDQQANPHCRRGDQELIRVFVGSIVLLLTAWISVYGREVTSQTDTQDEDTRIVRLNVESVCKRAGLYPAEESYWEDLRSLAWRNAEQGEIAGYVRYGIYGSAQLARDAVERLRASYPRAPATMTGDRVPGDEAYGTSALVLFRRKNVAVLVYLLRPPGSVVALTPLALAFSFDAELLDTKSHGDARELAPFEILQKVEVLPARRLRVGETASIRVVLKGGASVTKHVHVWIRTGSCRMAEPVGIIQTGESGFGYHALRAGRDNVFVHATDTRGRVAVSQVGIEVYRRERASRSVTDSSPVTRAGPAPSIEQSPSKETRVPEKGTRPPAQVSERDTRNSVAAVHSSEQNAAADGTVWPYVLAILASAVILAGVAVWVLILRGRH